MSDPIDRRLSRRDFVLATALAGAVLGPETARADELTGKWRVNIHWHDRRPVEVFWTLRGNGTFTSSDGYSGAWGKRGPVLLFAVMSDSKPSYAGSLSGQSIEGIALTHNGSRGFWSASLEP